jgi:precorrin-8X/cobalt-precorrin-8 methylmutase
MDTIRERVEHGIKKIILHPFFLSPGMHVTKDIPELIEEARGLYPGVEFIYTEPLGIHEKLANIVMERISAAEQLSPGEIEKRSFALLSAETDLSGISPDRLPIVQRVIHATADFEFKNSLVFHPEAVQRGLRAIKAGKDILTDVEMVRTGINKQRLAQWGGKVICGIQGPGSEEQGPGAGVQGPGSAGQGSGAGVQGAGSKKQGTENKTRSELGIEKALGENNNIGIIAIGNAPTALLKTIDLLANSPSPSELLVIGVPVGFVKALESKALLAGQTFPFITNLDRKGGTPVAVAIVNALLKMAGEIK